MNSTALTYTLSNNPGLMNHGWQHARLARDMADEPHLIINPHIESQVRSGDYFITLATTLDSLSQEIPDYTTRSNIEQIVSDLIYLYDNYAIHKK